ncbi:MAG: hypothetical protein P8123_11525 [bacterium]
MIGILSAIGTAIPLISKGEVAAATAAGMGLMKVAGGGSAPAAMPSYAGGGGLPALPVAQTKAIQSTSPGGLPVPWWKGPGGKLQMPWSDPRIPEYLKQFALDDAYLKTYYRAPRGYVVLRDANGRPFAINKAMAKSFGLWKPRKKPPISVSDWQAFKKAERVEKKLKKIAGPALRRRGYRTVAASASARASVRTRRK